MKNEKVDYTGTYIVKIDKLQKEIERLQKIIEESIKYLEERKDDNSMCSVCGVMSEKLLNILRGDKE